MQKLIEKLLPFRQPPPINTSGTGGSGSSKNATPLRKVQRVTEASTPASSSSSPPLPPPPPPPPSAPSRELLNAVSELQQILQTDRDRPEGLPNKYWLWMEEHNHDNLLDEIIPNNARQQQQQQQQGQQQDTEQAVDWQYLIDVVDSLYAEGGYGARKP